MPPPVWNPLATDERLKALALPQRGAALTRQEAQQLAQTIALRGLGKVAPNPLVGAVIVDSQHRFVAAGAHERLGSDHGEYAALRAAVGEAFRDSMLGHTLYVTLEPCVHTGKRTPPCAPRLIEAGFARVICGSLDPNPLVSGRGLSALTAAGIAATVDPQWTSACAEVAAVYLKNVKSGRPYVGLKAATTLDSVLARRGDQRQWITGARARQYGHFLRIVYDAVLVGRTTVEADNPTLDARDSDVARGHVPWRVVVDPTAAAWRADLKMMQVEPERVLWLIGANCPPPKGVKSRQLSCAPDGRFTACAILDALKAEGISSVLIEGGAGVYSTFTDAHVVDRLHLFQAAKLLGSANALLFSDGAGMLSGTPASSVSITPLDDDWVVEATWELNH